MSFITQFVESKVVVKLSGVNFWSQVVVVACIAQWTKVLIMVTGELKEWNGLLDLNIVSPVLVINWHIPGVGDHTSDWLWSIIFNKKCNNCRSTL